MKFSISILCFFLYQIGYTQSTSYTVSFDNAIHHEASIIATFKGVTDDTLAVRMSRTSPGRYALHEFAKNVYNVKAKDAKGNSLLIIRSNPYEWKIIGHKGTAVVSYTLFADRADGTYSQIDQTHAHLNIPATFMYASQLKNAPIEVTFNIPESSNWRIATQLKYVSGTTYIAPDLQYFMDSPVEISDHSVRKFTDTSNGKEYSFRFILHHLGTEAELDTYFKKVKSIVLQEKEVFGEYPDFENQTYTFLACYMPNVSGDGMEHRNSTILTDVESLSEGGMEENIGTVSHEFFHSWNVERIRPKDLEPFDFENTNMSEALWFAEGFTSYYTNLILCRAKVITKDEYVQGLAKAFNYVWNSPARNYFTPIEMSYQAPFVDAATSVDPVNRKNTFISYYSYGSMLGLALDLYLGKTSEDKNLDDYMKRVWQRYGKKEVPYTVKDLYELLAEYAGQSTADYFFTNFIYKSGMPDYKALFKNVGVIVIQNNTTSFTGLELDFTTDRKIQIKEYTVQGTPAYHAGLEKGDQIISINNQKFTAEENWKNWLSKRKVGTTLEVIYQRNNTQQNTQITLQENPEYVIAIDKNMTKKENTAQKKWLEAK
ncbi:PDZ domain-containing protein [Aquimarina sp. ERC-38]|uniref:M61 family metallopeptidase n=1 Tax=Aquimarina sp. ERC-38 TaxID=2949996 RepID=UPI0022456542|nr:PDZ domain-containing protein [Aquimarina sp. ERC-38]UZO81626.1 PDZ domain-containing protein [Aquimarina sp. ERC-38]